MKKLLVVMVITLMMASGAFALQADWQVDFELSAAGYQSMGTAYCAGWTGASNGLDGNDLAYLTADPNMLELDITNGPFAHTAWDIRDVPADANYVQIFNLKAFNNGGAAVTGGSANLKGFFDDTGGAYPLTDAGFFCYLFAGNLTQAQIEAAGPANALWVGSLANYDAFKAGFNVTVPLGAGAAPEYTLWAGKSLVSEVVPEPGSMLALFSGLVGLVGFGIRRRR